MKFIHIFIAIFSFVLMSNVDASLLKRQFKVMDLGTLESDESAAHAINDLDSVVGTYKLKGVSYVFLLEKQKEISLLDLPSSSIPKVINNKNQVAGQYIEDGANRGFFHDPIDGFCDIGSLGGVNTWIMDMNANGQVVGYSETGRLSNLRNGKEEIHAFVWHKGVMKDLGVLHGDLGIGGDESAAIGISDQGEIVGYSNYTLINKGKLIPSVHKAITWKNEDDAPVEIVPEISPIFLSKPLSISRSGKIALVRETESKFFRFLVLNPPARNLEFRNMNGSIIEELIKINDNGVIIISRQGYCDLAEIQGYGSYDSSRLKPSDPYWEKFEVFNGINNANKIVGTAKNIYGESHAVILIPN